VIRAGLGMTKLPMDREMYLETAIGLIQLIVAPDSQEEVLVERWEPLVGRGGV
jgi:hypothetical protein